MISASRVIFYYLPDIAYGVKYTIVHTHTTHAVVIKYFTAVKELIFPSTFVYASLYIARQQQVISRGCETTPRKVARDKLLRGITLLFEYRSDVNNTWRYYSLVHCLASRCSSFLHKVFTNRSFLWSENDDPRCADWKVFHWEKNIQCFMSIIYSLVISLFISLLFSSLLVLSSSFHLRYSLINDSFCTFCSEVIVK